MKIKNKIEYIIENNLLEEQKAFVNSNKKENVFLSGLGCGKSTALYVKLIKKIVDNFNFLSKDSYIVSVYKNNDDLINLITIPNIKELLELLNIKYELVKSEKIFIIKDFNTIINLRTLENINEDLFSFSNNLFIDYIDCLSIEEAELKYNKLLSLIVLNNLYQKERTVSLVSSIGSVGNKESNFLYNKFELNKDNKDLFLIKMKSYDNIHLHESFFNDIKKHYNKEQSSVYLDCEFI